MLTFEETEDCFPPGWCGTTDDGSVVCSAQWLHDFAKAVAAKENEACAAHVEQYGRIAGLQRACKAMADGIRMRSNVN